MSLAFSYCDVLGYYFTPLSFYHDDFYSILFMLFLYLTVLQIDTVTVACTHTALQFRVAFSSILRV